MKKQFLLIFISLFWASIAFGQLTGIKNIPVDYPTLADAITDLNSQGVGLGGVTIFVAPGNPQTAPAGGYVINTTTTDPSKPIIIDGGGNTIMAPNPQPSGNLNDAIFKIIGTDWVTIQNCVMQENPANNVTTATSNNMTEFGVALFYNTTTDGPQNCSIINNTITLGSIYQNAFGIYATSRTTATNMTVAADITDPNGAFHNLHIIGNTINGVNMGVVLVGSLTGDYMAQGIVINNNKITFGVNGTFSGYQSVSGSAVAGILTNNVLNTTINNNKLTSNGTLTSGALRGIYHYATGTLPTNIKMTNYFNGNNIYLLSAATSTASIYGMHLNNYNDSVTNYIISDTIIGLNSNGALTSAVYGIYHQGTAKYQYISKNIFDIDTKTSGSIYLINGGNTVRPYGIQVVDSNRVDLLNKTTAGGTVYFYYSGSSSDSTVKKYFTNNLINNVTLTGGTTFYGFYDTDGLGTNAAKRYYYNNVIQNVTGGTSAAYGIYVTYGKVLDIYNNIIQSIVNGAAITGIYAGGSSTVDMKVYNNKIQTLTSTSGTITGIYSAANGTGAIAKIYSDTITGLTASSGSVYGIQINYGVTTNIYNNLLYNLSGSNVVYGIFPAAGTTNNIYANKMYDMNASGSTGSVAGIYVSSGTTNNIYNNFIKRLYAPTSSGTNQVQGISLSGGTTDNVYYNTIYLDANSSGADFGTSGIYASTSPTTIDLKNNIVVNNSTPAGTGLTVALRRAAASLTQYNNSSNNNLFYAGTPGASNLIYYDGTTPYQTLSDFQTLVTPRDGASITEMPPFVDIANAPYDLHINTAISTGVESGGMIIPGIDTDFDGDLRFGATGYTGTGTAPDIGADEFNGVPSYTCTTPDPGNTIASSNPACFGETVTLSLQNIIPGTGVSYQWKESTDGISYTDIPGAINSTYTFTMTATKFYKCDVTCQNGPVTISSMPITMDFTNKILSTTGATLCGAGQATLTATGTTGADIVWYSTPTGGSPLYTGSPFTTPLLTSTTNYYVAAQTTSPINVIIGTGTTSSTSAGYTPFYTYYKSSKNQILFLASELRASGLGAGDITALAFNFSSVSTTPMTNFAISMGHTTDNALTTTYLTGLTTVYTNPSFTPAGTGWQTITFSTPFTWDGTSNIVIQICDGENSGYSAGSGVYYSTTSFNSHHYGYMDGGTGCNMTSPTYNYVGTNRPNIQFYGHASCSSPREQVTVTVTEASPINIGNDTSVCNNSVAHLFVHSGASNYETFTWSPTTNLYSDAACTTPYAGESTQNVYMKTNQAGTYSFVCFAQNSLSGCSTTDTINVTVLPANISVVADPAEHCISGTSLLTISPSTGFGNAVLQWASSTDGINYTDITGANDISYSTPTLTTSTYYRMTINVSGNTCLQEIAFVKVNNPQILSTTPATRCGVGSVILQAQSDPGSIISWYNAATGGSILAIGESFTTPILTSTTSFYVSAEIFTPTTVTIGAGVSTSAGAESPFYHLWGGKKSQYMIRATELTAAGLSAGYINSITFQVTSVGTVPFNGFNFSIGSTTDNALTTTLLSNLTSVFSDASYMPVVGENTITFSSPYYWDGTSNLVVEFCWSNNNTGSSANSAHMKYDNTTYNSQSYIQRDNLTPDALCALTASATTAQNRPQFIIDGEKICASPRQEVVATITMPPAITASVSPNDTICDGEEITLSVSSSNPNYEYTWNYDSNIFNGETFTDNPHTNTIYYVLANDPLTGCANMDSVNLIVYPSPSISVSANPTTITCGQDVHLSISGSGLSYTPFTLISENFNDVTHTFTAINNSSGGTPANAAWTLRPDGYSYGSYSPVTFHSNDNSQFIMSNSDAQGSSSTTNTELISPEFSTVGFDSLTVDFYHYFRSSGTANVDIYDGTQWVNIKSYTSTVGTSSSFVHETINLSDYAGLSNVKVRFKYQASWGYYWAIDNVTITGFLPSGITWTSNPAGFTSTIANPIANPIINTTYIATSTNNYGCSGQDSIAITVNPINVAINADQTQICLSSSANLTATGAENYSWSDGTNTYTGANITVSPTTTTTYSVTGTTALGCMNTAQITITVNSFIIKVDDISICSGESYTWYGNVYNMAGTYYDTIPASIGCDTAARLNLTILPLPTITVIADNSTVCSGSPVILTANGGVSYVWSTTQTGSSITVNPIVSTTYTVTGTDANGCENTAEAVITVNPLPDINITADNSYICIGSSATLTATGGDTYLWSTNETGNSITVNPTVSTTYTVTGTDANGCENTYEITINLYANYELEETYAICQGDVYTWHGNNYSVAGTYYDSLLTVNGCDSVYILHLTVNPLPNITASANPGTVCSGSPATLTANGGVSYVWSTTQTGSNITVNPISTSTYTVTGTDANSCENTAIVTVNVNSLPSIVANATPAELCLGESTTISASGATSYLWNTGDATESFSIIPDQTTTYVVTGTDVNNCQNTAEITVIVNPLPQLMLTPDNTTICSGQSVTLTASSDVAGTTYLWNNGLTDAVITQYPTTNTNYAVTATTPAGCQSTEEIDITVNPSPTVDLGEDIVQCGGTVTLDAGAGFSSYQWNPPLSNNQTMTVAMSGTYSVTVTNEYDCSATDQILVTISNVTVSLAETESGLEATIDPIVSGNYTWYTCNDLVVPGVTGAIFTDPIIGECYFVVFTDENSCEFISNQVTVTSIADNILTNAIVYPVPTTDKVTIELINNSGADVYLYDMLGQLVNTYKMNDSKLTIDVSKLSGNFLLKVITPDNTVNNFRIVVTK
jgi:hypothetical protein